MGDVIENKFFNARYVPAQNISSEEKYSASHKNEFCTKYDNNNLPKQSSLCNASSKTHSGDATFVFWALIVFILILAVGNLILTFVILGVLRLGQGMESIQLMSEHNLVTFFGQTDLDLIDKSDGILEGFSDIPVDISSEGSSVLFRINSIDHISPSIDIGMGASYIQVDSFVVTDPITGVPIFSTNSPDFGIPKGVEKLDVKKAETNRIVSPVDQNLVIQSETRVKLKGAEGTRIDGREVVWSADQDIYLKSVNKSIILSGSEGVYVDLKHIPIAKLFQGVPHNDTYKICVCMPQGKLFRVPVTSSKGGSCILHGVTAKDNPCL